MKTFHLIYKNKLWVLEAEKPEDAGLVFEPRTLKENRTMFFGTFIKGAKTLSIEFCRAFYAEHGEPVSLRIHKKNGEIQEERTYPRSADPEISKG